MINILFLPRLLPLPFALLQALPGIPTLLLPTVPSNYQSLSPLHFRLPEGEMNAIADMIAQLSRHLSVDRPYPRVYLTPDFYLDRTIIESFSMKVKIKVKIRGRFTRSG